MSNTDYEGVARDANGNVTAKRLRDSNIPTYTYDNLDCLVSKTQPGERTVTYAYDLLGRLKNLNRAADGVNHNHSYDGLGRLLREDQVFGSTADQASVDY